jgi:hypothetical protein
VAVHPGGNAAPGFAAATAAAQSGFAALTG